MKVQDAVTTAKKHIQDLYSDEEIVHVGLEEVVLDDDIWKVTIGFSRPWDISTTSPISIVSPRPRPRTYKRVTIKDGDGEVLSIENRDPVVS